MLVGGGVETFVLPGEVERPVLVEVAVVVQGAELEDGLGAVKTPAGAGDVEAVADQVAEGTLDRASGDRPARRQGGVVAELIEVAGQVAGAGVDGLAFRSAQAGPVGLRGDLGGGAGGLAVQDGDQMAGDPGFGISGAGRVEGVRRLLQSG